jgi:serine protease AprX
MWRKPTATALSALVCLFGLTATVDASPGKPAKAKIVREFDRKPTDHPKLDRKLNDRADRGAAAKSRVILELNPGYDLGDVVEKLGGRRGRKLNIIGGELIELPNNMLRKLAEHKAVKAMHHDRATGGEMNRAAVVEGARAVQQAYGYDGAGIGVAVVDSGIVGYHQDLTHLGNNSAVRMVNGQRVTAFVDFVNGRSAKYDDNGHGSHVSGIIAGNGLLTLGARAGIAPAAHLVSLKVLDERGGGYISNVIAALDWIIANRVAHNIRVVNLSVGAAVTESYTTDPLTLAAKRVVDQGVVVVTAAGNLGKHPVTGQTLYGGITAPGNAPWVLTVGAYSHEGTLDRGDDKMGGYSSRGPTARDFVAKPDVVATGTGIVSLAAPGSLMYTTKAAYLLKGSLLSSTRPYLSLTGTSMASPVVAGTVALMLQANPNLTPNLIKGIIQYTAQTYHYDALTQGAGFLNTKGAVDLARFLKNPQVGQKYPSNRSWSKTILWGNVKVRRGVIKPAGSAWAVSTIWGAAADMDGDNIVWGTACATPACDTVVWGTAAMDADNIVWGTFDAEGDNIVWGTAHAGDGEMDNIVWGTACLDGKCDNVVWGSECAGANCEEIVWGASVSEGELDNIVWGTMSMEADNIVWGTSGVTDGIIWGTNSEEDNLTWGCSGEETPLFDDPNVPSEFDGSPELFDALFDGTAPVPTEETVVSPPPAILPTNETNTILTDTPITQVIGGGL